MADVETLRTLKLQISDTYLSETVVGMNALCILGGWRWEGGTLMSPSGPIPDANRGLPNPHDNPALSFDAAMELAELTCPREWPDVLRQALTAQSQRHSWHTNFPQPGQRGCFPRAILLALVTKLLSEAEG